MIKLLIEKYKFNKKFKQYINRLQWIYFKRQENPNYAKKDLSTVSYKGKTISTKVFMSNSEETTLYLIYNILRDMENCNFDIEKDKKLFISILKKNRFPFLIDNLSLTELYLIINNETLTNKRYQISLFLEQNLYSKIYKERVLIALNKVDNEEDLDEILNGLRKYEDKKEDTFLITDNVIELLKKANYLQKS